MNVLIAIPVYKREELAYNCIMSLLNNTRVPDGINVTVMVGINEANKEFIYVMESMASNINGMTFKVRMYTENLGKPKVVNDIAKSNKFDYLVSLDGDMICVQPDWLIGMLSVYREYNRSPIYATVDGKRTAIPMGGLCGNQFGNSCHQLTENTANVIVKKIANHTVITSIGIGGIAGGILMCDLESWTAIGGYSSAHVYGGDDGYFFGRCYATKRLFAYTKTIGFYHPYELNKKYQDWKNRALNMIRGDGPVLTKSELKGFKFDENN